MKGIFLDSNFTLPVITVDRCKGRNCKDPSEINNLLKGKEMVPAPEKTNDTDDQNFHLSSLLILYALH